MINVNYILGVDPGPMVGIVGLLIDEPWPQAPRIIGVDVVQCSDHVVLSVLGALHSTRVAWPPEMRVHLAMEQFVVGPRTGKLNAPIASAKTRDALALLKQWASSRATVVERRAADVKPWATDARLDAAGLSLPTKGMRHARDAARHALFTAVRSGLMPDPLSARSGVA